MTRNIQVPINNVMTRNIQVPITCKKYYEISTDQDIIQFMQNYQLLFTVRVTDIIHTVQY